jgi:hypothetical protein
LDIEYLSVGQERIPTFDGDEGKYTMLWAKIRAFATLNGF